MKHCLATIIIFASVCTILAACEKDPYSSDSNGSGKTSGKNSKHEYVDLGLPSGVKWATCNVGATAPEEYGDYFAWGETEPYYISQEPLRWKEGKEAGYSWASYSENLQWYSSNSRLDLYSNDDAASINWGDNWRMPTEEDWNELRLYCNTEKAFQNGVFGLKFTSLKNGKSIFFPAAGYRSGTELYDVGTIGWYRLPSQTGDGPTSAVILYVFGGFFFDVSYLDSGYSNGESIRPVLGVPVPVPEAIDLGLSVKWASFNLGASAPEEYGNYYAWGEIKPKGDYDWASYQWCNGSRTTLTKYNTSSSDGPVVDDKVTLELADDAARVNLGGKWRIPTREEWEELLEKCTWKWTSRGGVNGYNVTGPNGNSIFLPAAGDRGHDGLYGEGSDGSYWSSSLDTDYPHVAWYLFFSSGYVIRDFCYSARYNGQSVRPVTE